VKGKGRRERRGGEEGEVQRRKKTTTKRKNSQTKWKRSVCVCACVFKRDGKNKRRALEKACWKRV
jgi:hypothetical protein